MITEAEVHAETNELRYQILYLDTWADLLGDMADRGESTIFDQQMQYASAACCWCMTVLRGRRQDLANAARWA